MAADIKTRTATTADTDAILEFLRVNFPRRKLYYENRQFFLNEFQADDNMLNFWLAADESSGELLAVSSYYPANTKDSPDIISGIWYAKDSGPVMLGFLLRREMLKHLNARFFCGTTAVESSFRSHRSFAKWINPFQKWILRGGGYTQSSKYKELTEITAAAELKKCLTEGQIVFENAVEKDFSYFYRRYWQNPFLGYRTFSFQTDKGTESLVVLKKDSLKSSLILFDYAGRESLLPEMTAAFAEQLARQQCDRLSFRQIGFDETFLAAAGFEPAPENEAVLYGFANQPIRMTEGDGIFE